MAEHASLAEALAAFQAEVPKMSKDETAKVTGKSGETGAPVKYTYGYAGLDQFVEIVEPVLGKHGLSVTSRTTFTDGLFMLEVSLVHEGGERETAYWPLPDPRRSGPQDLGSAMTYGRRYLGWGLTGTFPGGIDDDGAKAQQAPRDNWDSAKPARPVSAPPAPPQKTTWSDIEVAALHAKLSDRSKSLAQTGSGYDWMAERGLHNRPVGVSGVTGTLVLALRLADTALTPDITPEDLTEIKGFAEGRGLLKVKVSATETLEQVIYEARELAEHALAESSPGSSGGSNA